MQTELSFFEKGEMYVLLLGTVEGILRSGTEIRELLQMAREIGTELDSIKEETVASFADGEVTPGMEAGMKMVGPILRVLSTAGAYVPTLMEDMFLLFLHVPPWSREDVRPSLRKIDDELGFSILEVGFEQNRTSMLDFSKRLWEKVAPLLSTKTETSQVETGTSSDDSPTSSD